MMRIAALFLLLVLVGCGDSKPAMAPAPAVAGAESPADRCLAIATTKRSTRADAPPKVTVKHILVRYAGAKRAGAEVTRSREDACLRAQEARSKLEGGEDFDAVMKAYSEDKGIIGSISRSDVSPLFAGGAFELERGSVGHVVETEAGFHVIMRTE